MVLLMASEADGVAILRALYDRHTDALCYAAQVG
jgi:hypothetical protein